MISIGLTGGLGSGKTSVLEMFASLGAQVANSDDLVHAELRSNRALASRLVRLFGREILTRGRIDRAKIALKAFSDRSLLMKLNALIHPLVKKKLRGLMASARSSKFIFFVAEIPLLFETGMDKLFDVTVAVSLSEDVAMRRLMKSRGWTRKQARARMVFQIPPKLKESRCDYRIHNGSTKALTLRQVKDLLGKLKEAEI